MKCLILGGNGFIGSHVTECLIEAGHQVTVYDQGPGLFGRPRPEVCYILADLDDGDRLLQALAGQQVVIHLIGTTVPASSTRAPVFDVESNVLPTIRLLQHCVSAGIKRIVFASSGGTVYGIPQSVPIPESHPTQPISSYGITKLMIEKYLALFSHLYGLEYIALRASNVYGERQDPRRRQGAIGVFLWRLKNGEFIDIWGDGSVVRDYVYVWDVARAYALACEHSTGNYVLNIGSGRGVSLNEIIDLLPDITGLVPQVKRDGSRLFDVPVNVLDITLAQREIGWQPETGLRAGLQRTWRWYRDLEIDRQPGDPG